VHLALIKYSVLRLGLFVGSLIVLWAVGMRRSILMFVLAAAISLALSYLLLRKQRDEVALALQARVENRVQRRSTIGRADADEEDAAVDAGEATRAEATRAEATRTEATATEATRVVQRSDRQTDGQQQGVDQS
jgi:hypothetical protein